MVKIDPPLAPRDVLEPVPVPGKRVRGRNNGKKEVRACTRGEVFGAMRDADLRRGEFGHWDIGARSKREEPHAWAVT